MPKYKHDCSACKFLGHFFEHDVYICVRKYSIIARWGDNELDYTSSDLNPSKRECSDIDHKISVMALGIYQLLE